MLWCICSFSLYNGLGKRLKELNKEAGEIQMDLNLPTGIYTYELATDFGYKSGSLIVR